MLGIRTKRGRSIFVALALLLSALIAAALIYAINRPQTPAVTIETPETDTVSPERQEVACIDRLLKSEIPKGTDVDRLVANCRAGGGTASGASGPR